MGRGKHIVHAATPDSGRLFIFLGMCTSPPFSRTYFRSLCLHFIHFMALNEQHTQTLRAHHTRSYEQTNLLPFFKGMKEPIRGWLIWRIWMDLLCMSEFEQHP